MDKSRLPNLPEPRSRLRKRAETITANRVTLLPGFLQHGVRSETVRKSSSHYDAEVLSENLHGLLRRSTRLAGKERRSKSIFKEIEEKYARRLNHDFGARLFASLGPEFGLRELQYYKQGVREEVEAVNDVLAGRAMSVNRKRAYCEEEKENYPLKIYVPPTKWVFQTPPNRKLNYSNAKVEDTCLKPAILETRNEGKVVYEVNNKINVDFSRYSNRQELDIDKRYMVEVGNTSEDFTFQIHEQEASEKKFEFQTDPFELENHFLNLTCRPKKAQCAVSRMPVLKRKRDIFEPEASGSTELETVNEFDSSFTFINNNLSSLEESFTFKFTANEGATTGHIFDFDGNKKDTFDLF